MTWRPTSVDPVNATRRTPGCARSASPTSAPLPVTTLTAPGGNLPFPPAYVACWINSTVLSVARGVVEAGLITIVLPAAIAGPTFVPIRVRGKFHGTIPAQTPIGWRITRPYAPFWGNGT